MNILIIGSEATDKIKLAKLIQSSCDDLTIAPMFTSDLLMKDHITDDYRYYMAHEDVELSYKNNAFMWVLSNNKVSNGVTLVDMYNSDIFVMSYAEFNNMSNPVLSTITSNDYIIIWLDTKNHTVNDRIESDYAVERLSENKYLYFCDDDNFNDISKIIIDYYLGDEEKRTELLNEYN